MSPEQARAATFVLPGRGHLPMRECQPDIVIVRADGAELSRLPQTVKK